MHAQRRSFRLIRPRLQLRLMLSFLGISLLALFLQYLVFMRVVTELSVELPNDGNLLMSEIPRRLLWVLLLTTGFLLPTTLYVGVLVTRRVAGPIYRFEVFLEQVVRGEKPKDCSLRNGDELKDFCALLNQATAPLRRAVDTHEAIGTGADGAKRRFDEAA